MNIDFTGRHFQLDDQVKDYTQGKIGKIVRFLDEPIDIQVVLTANKNHQIAELHVNHRHGLLQATETAEELRDAIHAVVEKAEKQARRARKKHVDKKRRAGKPVLEDHQWPLDVVEKGSVGKGERPRVIKSSSLRIKPMTIDEAALELDRSKNDFFVFRDSGTERVSVLYRRRDDNYGLIAPDF